MNATFWFFMGVLCTTAAIIIKNKLIQRFKYVNPYLDILKHAEEDKLKFKKRLNNSVVLTGYGNKDIIYNMIDNDISVFKNDECVLVSVDKIKHIVDNIIKVIEHKFYNEVYKDVTIINGITYSNNLVDNNPLDNLPESKHTVNGETAEPMIEIVIEDEAVEDIDDVNDHESKINGILFKIKKFGIDSLSKEDLEFIEDTNNW